RLNQAAMAFDGHWLIVSRPVDQPLRTNTLLGYDFLRNAWFTVDGWTISASTHCYQYGASAIVGSCSCGGEVYRLFDGHTDLNGEPMEYVWKSKDFTFETEERYKVFRALILQVEQTHEPNTLTIEFYVDGVLRGVAQREIGMD